METFHKQWNERVTKYICDQIDQLPSHQERLKQAMKQAIKSGGKGIRPFFVLNATRIVNGDLNAALPVAASIEMIHTYSLIHDDLPALDNDELRRGLPTLHVAFDEATAILAGDAFLTLAFEVLIQAGVPDGKKVELIKLFSHHAGGHGIIAGQMLDIAAEKQTLSLEELRHVHREKTGKLFDASIRAGLLFGEISTHNEQLMEQFSDRFGLAFQIHNDLQDALWDTKRAGKTTGKDQSLEKNTYVSILGSDAALNVLKQEVTAAKDALEQLTITNEQQERARNSFLASLSYLEV